MRTIVAPALPPGFTLADTAAPPQSGALAEITTAAGVLVTLHPAEYVNLSPLGEWTDHGYAWRCTACGLVTTGYPQHGYTRAQQDATGHACEEAGQ